MCESCNLFLKLCNNALYKVDDLCIVILTDKTLALNLVVRIC